MTRKFIPAEAGPPKMNWLPAPSSQTTTFGMVVTAVESGLPAGAGFAFLLMVSVVLVLALCWYETLHRRKWSNAGRCSRE